MNSFIDLQENVLSRGLCCGCGTCIGVCPVRKITAQDDNIVFNDKACIECGRCMDCCPGAGFDFSAYNDRLFSDCGNTAGKWAGSYSKIQRGCAADEKIKKAAASGGLITAISAYMLRENKADYCIGVGIDSGSISACTVLIENEQELLSVMGSKYILYPLNEVIAKVLSQPGRYVYVGLPCEIQGLRKAMEIIPLLKERITLVLGIFCGFNMTGEATEYLLKKGGIEKDKVSKLSYRENVNGETGFYAKGLDKDGKEKSFFISKHGYTLLNMFYAGKRCLKCYDYTAEFSDISLGDAWEKENGWSRIVIRSEKGKSIIADMTAKGLIIAEDCTEEDIHTSARQITSFKKSDIVCRRNMTGPFPDYNTEFEKLPLKKEVKASLFTMALGLCGSGFGKACLGILPISFVETLSKKLRKGNGNGNGEGGEIVRYLFWGAVTTLVNLVSFAVLNFIGVPYQISNLLSIVITKTTAFLSNKFRVFKTKDQGKRKNIEELIRFIIARGFTGVVEFFGLIAWVDLLKLEKFPGKFIMIIITTILNYVLGKWFVFTKERMADNNDTGERQ